MLEPNLPRKYLCYRARKPILIDGRLDDEAWQAAPWTDYFVDIEGDRRPRPRFRTRAKMLWDDSYFYIGAELEEPHVWATLTQHDSVIFHDNDFEVFIDPDGDNHEYYELEINALNTTWDLRLVKPYRDGGPALNEWEIPGMRTAVHVDGAINDPNQQDAGWSVEIALPWASLKQYAGRTCPPREGDQWRVNFSRVEWQHTIDGGAYRKVPNTREDNWVWSPQGVIDMHRPEEWGFVQFTRAAPGRGRFDADPTWNARRLLMAVYHAQREFHGRFKHWARSVDELPLPTWIPAPEAQSIELKLTTEGWTASTQVALPDGESRSVSVRQDSRLTPLGRR